MVGSLFGELVVGAVPNPGLLDEAQLLQHFE